MNVTSPEDILKKYDPVGGIRTYYSRAVVTDMMKRYADAKFPEQREKTCALVKSITDDWKNYGHELSHNAGKYILANIKEIPSPKHE